MIRIIYTNLGMIIGEKVKSGNDQTQSLKDPRMFQVQQKAPENGDKIEYALMPIIGFPNGMECGINFMSMDVTDESILNAYNRSTSKLVLPEGKNMGKIINLQ